MGVSPDNPNEAYFLTSNWSKTLDGGATIIDPPFTEYPAATITTSGSTRRTATAWS
jgi:hypothetical protein